MSSTSPIRLPRVKAYKPTWVSERTLRRTTEIVEKGAGVCHICGYKVIDPRSGTSLRHPAAASEDHLIPASKGGGRGANLALAHKWCNSAKGDKELTDELRESISHRMGLFLELEGYER